MKIKNMRRVENMGTLKAWFSVEWSDEMTINDCRLVEGRSGLFAAMPSKEYMDKKTGQKKYQSIVYLGPDLLKKVCEAALAEYGVPTKNPDQDIPF